VIAAVVNLCNILEKEPSLLLLLLLILLRDGLDRHIHGHGWFKNSTKFLVLLGRISFAGESDVIQVVLSFPSCA
jgi:hypothetical protein